MLRFSYGINKYKYPNKLADRSFYQPSLNYTYNGMLKKKKKVIEVFSFFVIIRVFAEKRVYRMTRVTSKMVNRNTW